jgi:hypothetical protein
MALMGNLGDHHLQIASSILPTIDIANLNQKNFSSTFEPYEHK